ncbi:hypothetical protein F3Y22_tig00110415pilonHSYRG00230 [Hibiscus syriacus]|uniref:Uncharacterized protein n=1 Tax=Hibiscus syriacus TaxID=106335 RepID=A0A6A3AMX3_HIBSY|nr:hypothetical protein F3Y22_tig00110415pilonHSYRG00230 [Hibiscus syriacus]
MGPPATSIGKYQLGRLSEKAPLPRSSWPYTPLLVVTQQSRLSTRPGHGKQSPVSGGFPHTRPPLHFCNHVSVLVILSVSRSSTLNKRIDARIPGTTRDKNNEAPASP